MPEIASKDACDLLDADHIAVKHLFVEYARLAASDGDRQAIAQKICRELTVHARIEEEIFYPALRGAIDTPQLLDEAEAEHQQAKELIARIEALPEAGKQMDELVTQLALGIEHHVKEERDCLFTKARATAAVDLDELGSRLKERQEELEGQAA